MPFFLLQIVNDSLNINEWLSLVIRHMVFFNSRVWTLVALDLVGVRFFFMASPENLLIHSLYNFRRVRMA